MMFDMNHYTKTTICGNIHCIKLLTEFRKLTIEYFNNIESDDLHIDPNIGEKGLGVRRKMNELTREVGIVIRATGTQPSIIRYPPPAIGGHITEVDLITNIFNLSSYSIPPINVIDVLDQALGVYYADKIASIVRTLNPFFWIEQLLYRLTSLPFNLLSSAGFNGDKIRKTFLGKVISYLLQMIFLIGTLLTILQVLGYNDLIESIRKAIDGL